MPIRFRCAYCNQLMAISRRKAGTVVRCPKCAGDIIVPTPEGPQSAQEQDQPANELGFEDPQFDAYLDEPAASAAGKTATQTASDPFADSAPSGILPEPSLKRRGLFLPMGMIFVVGGIWLLSAIVMFVLGMYIGRGR